MPWLPYGINEHGELVSIWDTPRGKTTLRCPYCGRGLTAKRGEAIAEHFAHTEETCRAAARTSDLPTLPCYDNFNLHLPPRVLDALRRLHAQGSDTLSQQELDRLMTLKLVELNTDHWPHQVDLMPQAKIPLGALPLMQFNVEQEQMIRARHAELEQRVQQAWQQRPVLLDETLTDLQLYRAQWRRILASTLYFLEIRTPESVLHKIGVTTRPIEERLTEIHHDLRQHFAAVAVIILGTWEHRGSAELYFKHRYRAQRKLIGNLTEYSDFAKPKQVIADLNGMKPVKLKSDALALLNGEPAAIERRIKGKQPKL